ncbi:MAG: HepT-like ribonuclease domain-containing protein [Bacteroidia bacterium]
MEDLETNITAAFALERELGIIGEALNKLQKMGVVLSHSDWAINFRNTLIHQYDAVSRRTIFEHVHQDLPHLKSEVEALLED